MQQKATVPIIIIAVLAVVGLVVFLGKSALAPPAAGHSAPPPWIDPVTNKPRVGGAASTPDAPKDQRRPTSVKP